MRYLFFDIECSEGKSICSFGYVITDEGFNILEKEDILINPQSYFHTGAWSKKKRESDPGISLAYPEREFKSKPAFPAFYKKIKSIITYPDQTVIGFSHLNDGRFLDTACERYGLPCIDYTFYDIQVIHKEYNGLINPVSTETLAAALELDISKYVPHKGDDDAAVSMLVTKGFCEALKVGLPELIALYPNCKGEHRDFKTIYAYKTRAESFIKVINRDSSSGNNTMNGRNYQKFRNFLKDVAPDGAEKVLSEEKINFCRDYECAHFREMLLIAQRIADLGGEYKPYPNEASCYVTCGRNDGNLGRVQGLIKRGKPLKILSFDDFLNLVGLSENELSLKAAAK